MRKRLTPLLLALLIIAPPVLAQDPAPAAEAATTPVSADAVLGHWLGTLDVGAAQLRLALEVTEGDDGLRTVLTSLDQGNTSMPVPTTTFEDGVFRFEMPAIRASFEGGLSDDGSALGGTFSQAGQSFPLTFERQEAIPKLRRPQEPQAPFPYATRDVTFENSAGGIELAGTVVTPEGEGPFPAVVFVSGSGPQDRDESLMGHKPFWVLADHLARHGLFRLVPAIVIGCQRKRSVAYLRLAGKLGFLQVRHADHVHAPRAVDAGLGPRRVQRHQDPVDADLQGRNFRPRAFGCARQRL
jgi:hypothetical protein